MGMSGAASANGCGYLGMAHARFGQDILMAVVIPAGKNYACLDEFHSKLKNLGLLMISNMLCVNCCHDYQFSYLRSCM